MKCTMRNLKCEMRKSGVSLITVLLFMLVATIAATATYKWITSEGRSSAARMMEREAYQSAVAGIESARSWITYHANETGALIKQYKDGKNVPVKMNEQLAEFVQAGQSFDVWLVGVNTESFPYKLKIMSTGRARNGSAVHSEVAIFNVNGLYQVKIPQEHISIETDFKYAYFGGSLSYEGESDATAMVVNGNWEGRPPKTTDGDFIITGDATLGGNKIDVKEFACIGGDLTTNNGFISKNLYVHGNTYNFNGTISQNAYFDGNMDMGQSCGGSPEQSFLVKGHMTVGSNAKVKFEKCQNSRSVDSNTCVIENGQILVDGNELRLNGGAWMSADYPLGKVDGSEDATNIIIGKDNDQNVYIRTGHPYSDYEALVDSEYTETKSKRNCPSSFKIRNENYDADGSDYNWQGTPYQFVAPTTNTNVVNVCGTLASQTADKRDYWYSTWMGTKSGYFVDYNTGWDDWDNQKHSGIFPEKTSMAGKYYIYNAPSDFLTFNTTQVLDDWRVFKNVSGLHVNPLTTGANPIPIYINDTYNFDKYFKDPVQVGSYMFAGSPSYRYYEPSTNTNNFYRYENNKPTGSPYCNKGSGTESLYRPTCHVTPWFTVKGTFKKWESTKPADLPCAESAKNHCDSIWKYTPGTGCGGSDFTVRDQLKTGYQVFEKYAGRASCRSMDHDVLDTCYKNAVEHDKNETDESKKYLYNGYMVLKLTAEHFKNGNSSFKGKYIIIIESGDGEMIKLPPTETDKDFVMLYLVNGFNGQHIENYGSGLYNYFIYTEKDISKITGRFTLSGTIYGKIGEGADKPCARVKTNNNMTLEYNDKLVSDMMLNGLICKNTSAPCGGPSAGAGSGEVSGATVTTTYISDSYYIGVAPQLSVTLESQYENNEKIANVNSAKNTEGSFIALPRVVFLTTDAVGKLENYYKIATLNSSTPATISSIDCKSLTGGSIPATGRLTENGNLIEDLYTCSIKGSVNGKQQTVPLYVKVEGEGATAPKVSFMEDAAEVGIGGAKEIRLNWEKTSGVGLQCKVTVAVSDHDDAEWRVVPNGANGDGPYQFTINTSNDPSSNSSNPKIFDVTNLASSDGAVYFMIVDVEGCKLGNPATEVVFNANSMTIKRAGLEQYCGATGPGYGTAECETGGEYYQKKSWPPCFDGSNEEIWVTANGQNCKPSATSPNSEWSCGITSNVTLAKVDDVTGCEIILPSGGISTNDAPFTDGDERTLYADIKAVQQTFHVGFAVDGNLSNDQKINVSVWGPGTFSASKTCSYADFKSAENRVANCDVGVYRNSIVTLTLDPGASKTNGFNYWKCEPGSVDCSSSETETASPYQLTITGENTVYAHFGETDKHCFFDEFKDGNGSIRYNRANIECSDGDVYCIDNCESVCEKATSAGHTGAKWKLVNGSLDNLDYSSSDGTLALKASATRGLTESEKSTRKAVVLSTAVAGKHGELKAQFKVPFEGVSAGDMGKATVKNSGFIIHSDPENESFLLLNVYAENTGSLKARLCLKRQNSEDKCQTKALGTSVSATSIVMVSAIRFSEEGEEKLSLTVWPSSWSSVGYGTVFTLANTNADLSGVEDVLANEYVGFSLADPNFKLHGIGWMSNTYGSECWETFPTISCSFKAAFAGGIVPLATTDPATQDLKPWTGLSAWYGGRTCTVSHRYIGTDACNGNESSYTLCGDGYSFSASGAHGYLEGNVEKRTAKVTVDNCDVYGEEAAWATNGVAANCGKFWVGELQQCNKNYTFVLTSGNSEGDYYRLNPEARANLRDAKLKVELDNPNGSEVEIYLFSKNETTGFYDANNIYSMPYKSNQQTGIIEIPVENLSNVDGFDPEKVVGIYVKTFGDNTITINSVTSSCDHVISIERCSASYDMSAQKWKINTVVNNYKHTSSISVTEDNSKITETGPSCNYPSTAPVCAFGNVGTNAQGNPQATNTSEWSHNPYTSTGDDTYNFTVSLVTDDDEPETLTCSTTGSKTGISASCGSLSRSTVPPGGNLPTFNYGISNCPDNQCKYKIKLSSGETIVDVTTTGDGTWDTPANAANVSGSALDEGTYKFVLTSENDNRAFVGCESPEFTVAVSTEGVVTGTCEISPATATANSEVTFAIKTTGDGTKWDERGSDNVSATLSGEGVSQSITVNRWSNNPITITAPDVAGTYPYSITYDGNPFCTANLTVQTLTSVLTATCQDIETYPLASTPWNIALTGNGSLTKTVSLVASVNGKTSSTDCNSSYCVAPGNINAPAGVADYTYTLTADGTQLCTSTNDSHNYKVQNPLVCKVNGTAITNGQEIEMEEGGSFTFRAEWAYDYGNGTYTNCTISGSNVNKANDCYNDPSKFNSNVTISPSGTGVKEYSYSTSLSVNGHSAGPFTCNWTMNVVAPTPVVKNCPTETINAEPGTTIDFTPEVTGCLSGCNYTVEWVGHSGDPNKSVTDYSYTSGKVSFPGDATDGNNTYRFTVVNKRTSNNSDDCEITVNYQKPTYDCPDDKPDERINTNVAVTPTNIKNCKKGCNYKVTTGSADGTAVLGPSTGYPYKTGDGSLGNVSSTSTGEITYYVTLSNPAGDGTACHFTVKYGSGSSGSANCFFAEDPNNASNTVITGSVLPKQKVYICVNGRSEGSNTTLTGKRYNNNQNENWNEENVYVNANQTTCREFLAPSVDGSYPFDFKVNSASICSSAPTLVVQTPDNYYANNSQITAPAGETTLYFGDTPVSPSQCQINCWGSSAAGNFSVKLGSDTFTGWNGGGGTLSSAAVCKRGATATLKLSHSATCQISVN